MFVNFFVLWDLACYMYSCLTKMTCAGYRQHFSVEALRTADILQKKCGGGGFLLNASVCDVCHSVFLGVSLAPWGHCKGQVLSFLSLIQSCTALMRV